MKLEPIMISFVLMAGVLIGMASFLGDVNTAYQLENTTDLNTLEEFNTTFQKVRNATADLEQRTQNFNRKGLLNPSVYYDAIMAFVDIGVILFQMPNMMTSNVNLIEKVLPIFVPAWLILAVLTIIAFIVAMRVASVYTKTDEI